MAQSKIPTTVPVMLVLLISFVGCTPEDPVQKDSIPQVPVPTTTEAPPKGPSAATPTPSGSDHSAPGFNGLRSLVPFDGGAYLSWSPAEDDHSAPDSIRYRIFIADEDGEQDYSQPSLETAAGEHSATISGEEGEPIFAVVRAVDEAGNEDSNEIQWQGTPFPVLHVDPAASPGGDGLTATGALLSLDDAIGTALGFEGVNIYLVSGEYQESVLLFEGMMVYGGFAPGFSLETRDSVKHRTILFSGPEEDIVVLPPGERASGLDGITLDGRGQARRGLVADDCSVQLGHLVIQGFLEKGLELRSELDGDSGSSINGLISDCVITGNSGEGLHLQGPTDITLRNCQFSSNVEEGIDIDPLVVLENSKSRVEIENCTISDNQDIGVRIRIAEPQEDPGSGGRLRLNISGNRIINNADHGISVDIRYRQDRGADLRARLEHNSLIDNQKSGIHVDGDAPGDFQLLGNLVLRNRGVAGLELTGDCPTAFFRVMNCALIENAGAGVLLSGRGTAWIDQSEFIGNTGAALEVGKQWTRISSSLLKGNGRPTSPSQLDHSLVVGVGQISLPLPDNCLQLASDDPAVAGTLGVDLGDPLVRDSDGSRCDIGILGGFHGSPAGSEGLQSDPPRALEITTIDPPAGSRAPGGNWKMKFNGSVDESLEVRVFVDGIERNDLSLEALGRVLEVKTETPIEEGSDVRLEVLPGESPEPEIRPQTAHPVFDFIGLNRSTSVIRC